MDDYLDNVAGNRRYERSKRKGYDRIKHNEKSFKNPKQYKRIKNYDAALSIGDEDSESINMSFSDGLYYRKRK